MGNTKSNVTAGKPGVGGAIWRAPVGTTLPTDAKTALDKEFKCLGYVSDEGVTNANSIETGEVKAWGGDTVLVTQNGVNDTFQFTLLEIMNVEVLKVVYGDENVTGTLATWIAVAAGSTEREEASYVIEQILRDGVKKRIVIPDGKLTAIGDINYRDNATAGYNTTLTALPDANEHTHYDYMAAKLAS